MYEDKDDISLSILGMYSLNELCKPVIIEKVQILPSNVNSIDIDSDVD